MSIIDRNYEENVYVVERPTLFYNENDNIWDCSNNINPFRRVETIPSHVSIRNNGGLYIPHVINVDVNSPFTDNPNLNYMFGIHILNKPFGFKKIKVIPQTYNYPYLVDDNDVNYGKTSNNKGVLIGYQLNGIKEDLVTVNCGDKNVNFKTLNKDDITNSTTERIFYTKEEDEHTYGEYQYDTRNTANDLNYQYIELDDDCGNLVTSDGYGVDVEEEIDMYITTPTSLEYDCVECNLKLINDGEIIFDKINVYLNNGKYIACTEWKWDKLDTDKYDNEVEYNLQVNDGNIFTDGDKTCNVWEYQSTAIFNGVQLIRKYYKFKFVDNSLLRDIIDENGDGYEIKNEDTGYETVLTDTLIQKWRVCCGLSKDDSAWNTYYTREEGSDSMPYVYLLYRDNSQPNGQIDGVNYRYNTSTRDFEILNEYTRNVSITNSNEIILTNNETVKIEGNGTFTTSTGYSYTISGYSNTGYLPYPLDGTDGKNIFELFKTTSWDNELSPSLNTYVSEEEENNILFRLNNITPEWFFIVGKHTPEEGVQHIVYSPKYTIQQPIIKHIGDISIDENSNTTTFNFRFIVDDNNGFVLPYLKWYDFSWCCIMGKKITLTDGSVSYVESINNGKVLSGDLTDIIDSNGENIGKGYIIKFETENGFSLDNCVWEITDISGLRLVNLKFNKVDSII